MKIKAVSYRPTEDTSKILTTHKEEFGIPYNQLIHKALLAYQPSVANNPPEPLEGYLDQIKAVE